MIPQRVNLPRVSYLPSRVNLRGYHTPASQAPRGIIPWWVNKTSPKTWPPGYDTYPRESISPGYRYGIIQVVPRRVSFFDTKVWKTQQNLDQNRKYLKPLISGPGWFEWWKKLEVKNLVGLSLWSTVPGSPVYCNVTPIIFTATLFFSFADTCNSVLIEDDI